MKKIFNKLLTYIETEDIQGLIKFCLILLPFVGVGVGGLIALISFVASHKETLILIGVATCLIVSVFMDNKKKSSLPGISTNNGNIAFFDRLLLQALYTIFTSYNRQFHIIPPGKFSDLRDELPSGMDLGKNVAIYRFKVVSDGEPIEPLLFHEILENYLTERLASGELALGKPAIEFNGKLYPKIYVDECMNAGGVWHIALLICDSENVANYIKNKEQTLALRHSPISVQYEDSDF